MKKYIMKLAGLVLLLALPVLMSRSGFGYGSTILAFVTLYVVATSGLDILFGHCGQISMGHAAFFAIGAYGSAMLHGYFNVPIWLTMILSSILAAMVGAVIAYPASKLVFHFLSLATIAFGEIIHTLVLNSPGQITGNAVGYFTEPVSLFGFSLDTPVKFCYFGICVAGIFLLVKSLLINSRVGRSWTAIRENSHAAEGMGINVTGYKVLAFTVSAFYTGFAGAMYAHFVGYIGPDTFTMKQSVMFVTMMLFGGIGSLAGPVCGTVLVLILNEGLRSLEQYQMLVYGILLLLVIVALPGGIHGAVKNSIAKLMHKIKGGRQSAAGN